MLINHPERLAPRGGYNLKLSLATCTPVYIELSTADGTATRPGLGLTLRCRSGPSGKNRGRQAAAGREFAADDAPFGLDGGDDVAQDFIDGVLVEDAEIAISEQVHFQGFQLDAIFPRHILDGDGAKIRQSGLRADGGILRKFRGDDVAGELVGPGLERGEFCVDARAGVFFGVIGHDRSSGSSEYCTTLAGGAPLLGFGFAADLAGVQG